MTMCISTSGFMRSALFDGCISIALTAKMQLIAITYPRSDNWKLVDNWPKR